jgi:hypothetical protein
MTQRIMIMRDELKKIVEVLEKFPDAAYIEIEKDASSGIGFSLKTAVPLDIEGTAGMFTVDISDVSNW